MDAIALMLLFQLKHWYVDFWIQTYQQTVGKGIYGDLIGVSHTLEHVIGTIIILLVFSIFVPVSPYAIAIVAVLDFIIHYHVDYVKMHYGTKDNRTTRYWREFGLDQLAHQLTYIGFVTFLIIQ